MVLLGLAVLIVVVMVGWVFFTGVGSDFFTNILNAKDSANNSIKPHAGETVCNLKIYVQGEWGIAVSLDFHEEFLIKKVTRTWSDCHVQKSIAPFSIVYYPEKLDDIKKKIGEMDISGRLFGDDITWWVELHDPDTGRITYKANHKNTDKIPAGFGSYDFSRTFLFENIPKKNLEAWIYSDDATFPDHAHGEPYKWKLSS